MEPIYTAANCTLSPWDRQVANAAFGALGLRFRATSPVWVPWPILRKLMWDAADQAKQSGAWHDNQMPFSELLPLLGRLLGKQVADYLLTADNVLVAEYR